jgi:hypothetical protein
MWILSIIKCVKVEYNDNAMALNSEKLPFKLNKLPEVFVSSKAMASAVSKAVKSGRLRKLGSRLYTRNLTEAPELIVKRNWHPLLKSYFPDALIADRTAFVGGAVSSRPLDSA